MRLSLGLSMGGDIKKRFTPNAYQDILILGASIMAESMLALETKALIDSTYGVNSTVYNRAVAGWSAQTLRDNIDLILADYTPTLQNMAVFMHIGGNDVSANRPYTSDLTLATLQANLQYIINAINTAGYTLYMANLTYRDYPDVNRSNEVSGSLPYNQNVLHPLIPNGFMFQDGTPWADLYTLMYNSPEYFDTDGIHLNPTGEQAFRQYLVDTLGLHNFTGEIPAQLVKDVQGLLLNGGFLDGVTTDWTTVSGGVFASVGTYTVSNGVATVTGGNDAFGIYQDFNLQAGVTYNVSGEIAVGTASDVRFRMYDGYGLDIALLGESTIVTSATLTPVSMQITPVANGEVSLYLRCNAPSLTGKFSNFTVTPV